MIVESVRAIVQARMSSGRFPGKVLAPLRGRPILSHVVANVRSVFDADSVVIATSTDASDDPVAVYARDLGVSVSRGPLHNVVRRFQLCLEEHPCTWFLRVCADSPLVDLGLFAELRRHAVTGVDLVTNTFPRTFPNGCSLELLYTPTFAQIDAGGLHAQQGEHVTKVYYDNPDQFKIINIRSPDESGTAQSLAVDTVQDLLALDQALRDHQS